MFTWPLAGHKKALANGLSLTRAWLGMVNGGGGRQNPYGGGNEQYGSATAVDAWPYGVSAINGLDGQAAAGVHGAVQVDGAGPQGRHHASACSLEVRGDPTESRQGPLRPLGGSVLDRRSETVREVGAHEHVLAAGGLGVVGGDLHFQLDVVLVA